MKKLTKLMMLMILLISMVACTSSDAGTTSIIDTIKERGVLRVGVKEDVPNFGLRNTATNEIEGYEIEIARLIAKEILGDASKVEFTPVTAKTRGPLLDNGDIDLVIATFTINDERKLTYNFSTAYYTDHVGLLVKTASGYTTLADMDGATIGVAQSATTKDVLTAAATDLGITLNFSEYATYAELKAALDSGRIQAFSVDKSILSGYLDDSTIILADNFSSQDYGVASKKTNTELADLVDGLVTKWLSDGTLDTLKTDWNLAD